jgi:hypothetical protein
MIELNFLTLLYLFLRLAPFIIVCFFVLNSLFNQDFRGLIYVSGLIGSIFFSTMLYRLISELSIFKFNGTRNDECTLTSLSKESSSSALPIGQHILGFTFFYLLFPIIKKDIAKENIAILSFYPILIVFDFIWNATKPCYSMPQLFASLILGASLGTLLSFIIYDSGLKSLSYFYLGEQTSEICQKPSKQTFNCKVFRNGKLITSQA